MVEYGTVDPVTGVRFSLSTLKIKMETLLPRGIRDYGPEEKILRDEIIGNIKRIFELYGYAPLETPIIERYEVLSAKYAGGAEILKETFRLKDHGNRELGLRYDLTVPLARYLAMNQITKMPFKRYQIGEIFRDGPIKSGRTRQFTQCDADVVGIKTVYADAECIRMALSIFKALKIDAYIEVNSRVLLDAILEKLDVENEKRLDCILILDKLKKIGINNVCNDLRLLGLKDRLIKKLLEFVSIKGNNDEKLKRLKEVSGIDQIRELLSIVKDKKVIFNPSLSRGLGYYTGIVFEAFLEDESIISCSIAGGGRYDTMIRNFINNRQEYPAVGISFGIEPIIEIMKNRPNLKKTTVSAYIIPINTIKDSMKIADEFRKNSINIDIDMNGKSISKNLDYADKLRIPYAIIIGEDELKKKKLKLKDMRSGKEKLMSKRAAIKTVRQCKKIN